MDLIDYNRRAWDGLVERGNEWTVPVSREVVEAARQGRWEIVLTPRRPVPRDWFPALPGTRTLCLAGSGGQQAPILAAAGAAVTVLDNSPRQLAQDRLVAEREGLELVTVLGDMRDLRAFEDESFELVVHPCSNCFVPEVRGIWREVYRVLRRGGVLMAGFVNPAAYVFDDAASERGELIVRHTLPYSDQMSLTEEERRALIAAGEPFEFSHSLEDLIGGQVDAGLVIEALYEDHWPRKSISRYMPIFIATRVRKPSTVAADGSAGA
jgi:SAM-dependent methyltransferase